MDPLKIHLNEIIQKPVDDQLNDDDDILQKNKEFVEQINSTLATAHPILYYEHDLCVNFIVRTNWTCLKFQCWKKSAYIWARDKVKG